MADPTEEIEALKRQILDATVSTALHEANVSLPLVKHAQASLLARDLAVVTESGDVTWRDGRSLEEGLALWLEDPAQDVFRGEARREPVVGDPIEIVREAVARGGESGISHDFVQGILGEVAK